MADNTGIFERKGKKGISLLVDLRFGKNARFTKTIRVADYPTKAAAYSAARIIRDKARVDFASNRLMPGRVPTVGELYERKWELSGASVKTRDRQDSVFKACLERFKNTPLDEVTAADIQQSIVEYAETHSQDLVKRAVTIWRQIYACSASEELNVADKTVLLKPVKSKVVVAKRSHEITYDDFVAFQQAMLDYNADPDGRPCQTSQNVWYMLWIMYYTGCRVGEALAIGADDYDRSFRTLRINKAVGSTANKRRCIITPKTAESVREIPVAPDLANLLDALIEWSDTTPLLVHTDGLPYEIDYVSNYVHLVSKKCGIPFNAYRLRHLFSTQMFQSGQSSAVIRDLMGHASSSMSLDYATSTADERANAVKTRKK